MVLLKHGDTFLPKEEAQEKHRQGFRPPLTGQVLGKLQRDSHTEAPACLGVMAHAWSH